MSAIIELSFFLLTSIVLLVNGWRERKRERDEYVAWMQRIAGVDAKDASDEGQLIMAAFEEVMAAFENGVMISDENIAAYMQEVRREVSMMSPADKAAQLIALAAQRAEERRRRQHEAAVRLAAISAVSAAMSTYQMAGEISAMRLEQKWRNDL